MADTVVVHLTKCAAQTTIASARIAKYIATMFDLPLVDQPGLWKKQYKNIIYVNSMGAFAPPELRLELAQQVRGCEKLIYVQNDYNVHPISQVQKVVRDERGWSHDFPFTTGDIHLWTTVPEYCRKPGDKYINWNALTFNQAVPNALLRGAEASTVFYWGACRPGRVDAFKRLLLGINSIRRGPVVISCAGKVQRKFLEAAADTVLQNTAQTWVPDHVNFCKPFKDLGELSAYGATVYMEDEASHTVYTSPANRFYEALSVGLFMYVDQPAVHTLEQAGYEVPQEWVVHSLDEIQRAGMPVPDEWQTQQKIMWVQHAIAERESLDSALVQAMHELEPERRQQSDASF